jgi:site-specific DNA recombinase
MKKAIIYIRVSTDEQADKGYSLRHQEEFLKKHCEFNNIQVLEIIKEDYSAKTFNRPAFTQLLTKLKSRKLRADFLVFTKWDRFSRNASDAYAMISTLNRLGIEPQAVEQPLDLNIPENKIMLAFYLSAPEVENDRRSLNTIAGMRRAKKEGRWVSSAPRGYENKYDTHNKKIITPNKDAPIIKWAFEQLSSAKFGVEEVRKRCIEKGFTFNRGSFHEIFKNPIYCGRIIIPCYKNEEEQIVKGIHEPIISEALYDKVQTALKSRRSKQVYKTCVQEPLPLRGFLSCPQCGKNLCGSGSTGGSGIKHYYYHCLKGCKERARANDVNNAYSEFIATFKFKSGVHELYTEILKTVFKVNTSEKNDNERNIQTEIEKNKERLNKAQQLMLDGEMEMSEYKEIKRAIEPKIDALLDQQLSFNQTELEYRSYLKKGLSAAQHLGYLFDNLDINGKREIIRSSLRKNLVFSDGKTRTEKPNELLVLISLIDVQHSQSKNKKGSKFCSLSAVVPRRRFELPRLATYAPQAHLYTIPTPGHFR